MDNMDDLKSRIAAVISEINCLLKTFEKELSDPQKAVSLRQVKEIEASVVRLKKQGLPVPDDLKQLKLRLLSSHERHKEINALHEEFVRNIKNLISSELSPIKKSTQLPRPRKTPDYERPLGSKGNSNLEDYLMPVIKLMWDGHTHVKAFHQVAEMLDVRYHTVSSQCTRTLGLTVDEFIKHVKVKTIIDIIERKYPDKYNSIRASLLIKDHPV